MQPQDYWGLKDRCLNCGFFSRWDNTTGVIFEVSFPDRFNARLYRQLLPNGKMVATLPFCFRRSVNFDLDNEIGTKGGRTEEEHKRVVYEVLVRRRECSSWYPYRQGLSPQEHLEELRVAELEDRRETFELKMEQDRRHFELELANRLERSEERRHSMMRWVAIVGAVLIAVEILAVVLGAGPGSLLGDLLGLD